MTGGDSLARILIVDDEPANVRLLERLLQRAGYDDLVSTTDPRHVATLVTAKRPDLILLDLHMPHLDGFAVMAELAALISPTSYLPILVLTADATRETRERALRHGAADFLTKPFEPTETVLRIRNLLTTRRLHQQLADQNAQLEVRVEQRTRELETMRFEVLERLALAAEYRDDLTHRHTVRVGQLSVRLARAVGVPEREVALIGRAAALHDIGKIGIPDRILLKPGPLTADEQRVMRTHTTIGAQIFAAGGSAVVRLAAEVAHTHHERWDGTGYPRRIGGTVIPLAARIVSVADVFDALTHVRPYKSAWSADEAAAEVCRQRGGAFDPLVVDAFISLQPATGLPDEQSRSA